MAYENKKTDKITKYVCTILSQHGIIIYITLRETTSINICTHANL